MRTEHKRMLVLTGQLIPVNKTEKNKKNKAKAARKGLTSANRTSLRKIRREFKKARTA